MNAMLTLAELESNDPRQTRGRDQQRFLCPFCGEAKPRDAAHRSLCVNVATGAWICHRCGERGLLKEYWLLPPRPSYFALPVLVNGSSGRSSHTPPISKFDWRKAWRDSSRLCGTPGAEYTEGRGIPVHFAETCGVRFFSDWYGRPALLFPIKDQHGALVAVSGRFIDSRKSTTTKAGGKKSQGVFSTPGAFDADAVAIVEGPMDALSLAYCDLPAIAMMGTSWPTWLPESVSLKSVLIATDADTAGDESAQSFKENLSAAGCSSLRFRPSVGKDWNDVLLCLGKDTLGFKYVINQQLRHALSNFR
ncbi:MAG: toprim domain-containing protein [Blastocatellia bacterium]